MKGLVVALALIAVTAVTAQTPGGWSGYGDCSALCGGGLAFRTCTNPPPSDGGAYCSGLNVTACNTSPCQNCTVSGLSGYSACTKQCGGGTQYRTRYVIKPAGPGGTPCPSLNITYSCNTWFCMETLGGQGYYFWGPIKGPGPMEYKFQRIDYEFDVFVFDQANFFQYQYDAARPVPWETNYQAIRASLAVENAHEIVPLDTTSDYYLVVDNTAIGGAAGTTNQNGQTVYTMERFTWWIGGVEYPEGVNTVPYISGASSVTSSISLVTVLIAAVWAMLR